MRQSVQLGWISGPSIEAIGGEWDDDPRDLSDDPAQFRMAIDAGVFGENHVELLGGIPFIMSQNPPHIVALANAYLALAALASYRDGL